MTTTPTVPSETATQLSFGKYVLHALLPLLFTLGGAWVLSFCITYVTDAPLQQIDRIQVLALTALLLFTQVLMNAHIYRGVPAEQDVAMYGSLIALIGALALFIILAGETILLLFALIITYGILTFVSASRPRVSVRYLLLQGGAVMLPILLLLPRILGL